MRPSNVKYGGRLKRFNGHYDEILKHSDDLKTMENATMHTIGSC